MRRAAFAAVALVVAAAGRAAALAPPNEKLAMVTVVAEGTKAARPG